MPSFVTYKSVTPFSFLSWSLGTTMLTGFSRKPALYVSHSLPGETLSYALSPRYRPVSYVFTSASALSSRSMSLRPHSFASYCTEFFGTIRICVADRLSSVIAVPPLTTNGLMNRYVFVSCFSEAYQPIPRLPALSSLVSSKLGHPIALLTVP